MPFRRELAMGAVADGAAPVIVRNEEIIRLEGIDESGFKAVCDSELAEIERRRRRYLGNRVEVTGRTAIVIDDGVATGATIRADLRATRMRNPKRLVLAVPVAPTESLVGTAWRCRRRCLPRRSRIFRRNRTTPILPRYRTSK